MQLSSFTFAKKIQLMLIRHTAEIEKLNLISSEIIGCAIEVHKELGPGLLESVYDICMSKELACKGIFFKRQVFLPVKYKAQILDVDFRIDFLVKEEVVVEIKTVEKIIPVHEAQILTYLKLSEKRLGLLINFNEVQLKNGIRRMVNGY
jgi:GxxExxY protein